MLADADDSVLLIVDLQTRLTAAMDAGERERVNASTAMLARGSGELDIPVIVTRQYPQGLGDTDPAVAEALPDWAVTLDKTRFSAAGDPGIADALRMTGRRQVVLCGMEAHVCVLQTALELVAAAYTVFVIADGICSRNPDHAAGACARLRSAGVTVTNRESVLFEWLRDAAHPSFRTVSGLLK